MSTPFIVVSTQRIKEGKLEEYKQFFKALAEIFEAREPRLIAFNGFLNEDETEVTVIQVHPDAASMDFHLQVLREEVGKASDKDHFDFSRMSELMEPKRGEYYGTPSEVALDMDPRLAEVLSVKPLHIGGFTRSTSG